MGKSIGVLEKNFATLSDIEKEKVLLGLPLDTMFA